MSTEGVKVFLKMSALGGVSFKLNYFKGFERLSEPFKYDLLMTAQSNEVNFDSLIGQSTTVSVSVGSQTRTYNGIVGHFEQDDTPFTTLGAWTVYRATLYPKFWLLKFSGQCRIFQNQSIVAIITSVLEQSQIPFSNQVTRSGMDPLEFCVQYNETDFNFVSRLMELAGIFYFFQQTESGHTLVLADSVGAYAPCPNAPTGRFHDATVYDQSMLLVSSCFLTQRIVPQSNTLKSYNYLTPQTPLSAVATGPADAGGGALTTYDEIYGQQTTGDQLVNVKLQSEEAPQKMGEGISTIPFFLPGHTFRLEGHPRSDANISYLLYEVVHEARLVEDDPENPLYKNKYKVLSATTLFRAPQQTPKPRIYSTQTAVVTGQEGQEIYTEQYGRIKVKFHWDPSPKQDETTSCWIRVATLWAGQAWGTLFTPRIGQEVVVSFIDGDPDNPLVVGTVYNGVNNPPYLPSDPTKSTIKSQTSPNKDKTAPGYNEFRYEDKQGSEEIYIYAQKDFNIKVQNDQNITLVGGNRAITLQAQDEQGETRQNQQSNDRLKLMNGDKSLEIVKGNYTILLDEGNISVTCRKGNVSFDVTGDISFNCTGNFNVKAGQSITFDATENISEKAGVSALIEAGADFSAKAGGAVEIAGGGTVAVKGATVEVTGALITLNG